MNEILERIAQRKSVRVYEQRPIPDEVKSAVLEAACQGATACNQQRYTILDITDSALKARLAETCEQPFMAKAPIMLVFCADNQRWQDAYHEADCQPRAPGVGDLMLAVSDTLIAAQNAVMAAESLGLGSCYVGNILTCRQEHQAMLGLPDYAFPAALLVMGWPTEQQKRRPKPQRFPPQALVCENQYYRRSGTELRALFGEKTKLRGFEPWLQDFCHRMYNSAFCRGISRSVEGYLSPYQNTEDEAGKQ